MKIIQEQGVPVYRFFQNKKILIPQETLVFFEVNEKASLRLLVANKLAPVLLCLSAVFFLYFSFMERKHET